MTMRGVKKPGSKTLTLAARGIYETDAEAKEQVLKAAECGLFWDFRRRPGFCVCCREYYSIPVFTSSAIPGGCLIGNCPKGHKASDIRMVEEEMPGHLSCPVCGSEAVISTEGLWD